MPNSFKDRALRFGAGVGAVGLAVGGAVMGYAHHNEVQRSNLEKRVASGMAEADRQGRISDIDELMKQYNQDYRPTKNKSYRKERGLREK